MTCPNPNHPPSAWLRTDHLESCTWDGIACNCPKVSGYCRLCRELETAVALAQGAALAAAQKECIIVRDSPVECVDPCTEDWIAQRIGMLNPTAVSLYEQAVAREVAKARLEMQEGIARVFDSYGPDVPKAKEAAALVRSLSFRPSRAIPASGAGEA